MDRSKVNRLTATGMADFISVLPPGDRAEIVGQVLAMAAGADIPAHKVNPLAADQLRAGTGLEAIMAALHGDVRGAISNSDLHSAISEALRHLTLDAIRVRSLEHRRICRMFALPDFKPQAIPASHPVSLTEVPEGQEIPALLTGANWQQTEGLHTFAGIVPFTRQSIINADWGLLRTIADELVDAAFRSERKAVFGLLAANPKLSDGMELFHPDRGNIAATSGAPSVASFSSALTALDALTANGARLAIKPRLVVVPTEDAAATSVLLYAGIEKLFSDNSPIVFDGDVSSAWYVLPDPAIRPVVGLAHLPNGATPTVDLRPKFTSDAVYIRCRHVFSVMPLSPFAIKVPIA